MPQPRAIFWDNDGVLVDTEPLFLQASREHLATYGIDVSEELYVDFCMRRGHSLFDLIEQQGVSPQEVLRVRNARDARYMDLLSVGVEVIGGVREALAALRGRAPMAIVTASGREHFEAIHRPLGLLSHFEFVLASGDYENHKPHPDPYLAAARRIGAEPGDCVAIEDSERGLQAALAAGMRCLVVPSGLSLGGDFHGAQRVLGSARELPGAIAEL